MELETTSTSRAKPFRTTTKGYLTKPQLDVHNAIHSYTKQLKFLANRTNSSSTGSTTTTTLIPIKTNNNYYDTYSLKVNNNNNSSNHKVLPNNRANDATITTINNNNLKQTNEISKISSPTKLFTNSPISIKMNTTNFIYQIPHQHRAMHNISSISDQTSQQVVGRLVFENDENKQNNKLRFRTGQSSAATMPQQQQQQQQRLNKKPIKLNPLTKTTNKIAIKPLNEDLSNETKLQFITLHKPINKANDAFINLNENLSKNTIMNKVNSLNDNKLTLFDSNKLNKVKVPAVRNKNNTNFKWSFNQPKQQQSPNDILASIFKGDKIIVDNFKIKKRQEKPQLDDIDEDYMEGIYSKSIFDKLRQNSPRSLQLVKQISIKQSTDAYESDTDTVVSASSLLSTSDKSCEVIYLCPVNQKLEEERRKKAQIRKYKARLKQTVAKPEEMFYNNNLSSSDDENSLRKKNNTSQISTIKNVKKNILTSLNKRLSANSSNYNNNEAL